MKSITILLLLATIIGLAECRARKIGASTRKQRSRILNDINDENVKRLDNSQENISTGFNDKNLNILASKSIVQENGNQDHLVKIALNAEKDSAVMSRFAKMAVQLREDLNDLNTSVKAQIDSINIVIQSM